MAHSSTMPFQQKKFKPFQFGQAAASGSAVDQPMSIVPVALHKASDGIRWHPMVSDGNRGHKTTTARRCWKHVSSTQPSANFGMDVSQCDGIGHLWHLARQSENPWAPDVLPLQSTSKTKKCRLPCSAIYGNLWQFRNHVKTRSVSRWRHLTTHGVCRWRVRRRWQWRVGELPFGSPSLGLTNPQVDMGKFICLNGFTMLYTIWLLRLFNYIQTYLNYVYLIGI